MNAMNRIMALMMQIIVSVCLMNVSSWDYGKASASEIKTCVASFSEEDGRDEQAENMAFCNMDDNRSGVTENERAVREQETLSRIRAKVVSRINLRLQRSHHRNLLSFTSSHITRKQDYFLLSRFHINNIAISDYFVFTLMRLLL